MIKGSRLEDTTLDDSAEIYKQREEKTEKQKLNEMAFKEKIVYFNSYYRLKVIIIAAILIFVGYLAYSILAPTPDTVLYAAVVNNILDDTKITDLQNGFADHLGIDKKKQEIMVDASFNLGTDNDTSQYTIGNQQKLMTYFYASQIDIMIAPESIFKSYAASGTFSKLSDQLPSDLCNTLTDSFYYSTTTDDSNSSAYGIYLDHASIYDNSGKLIDKPIIGIVVNSKYKSNAVEFIRYILNLKQ